ADHLTHSNSFCYKLRSDLPMLFFFFNDPPTTEIYTLSLHDALPIWPLRSRVDAAVAEPRRAEGGGVRVALSPYLFRGMLVGMGRSEEHTSELQSLAYLVCRLLLEKKKKTCNKHSPVSHTRHVVFKQP